MTNGAIMQAKEIFVRNNIKYMLFRNNDKQYIRIGKGANGEVYTGFMELPNGERVGAAYKLLKPLGHQINNSFVRIFKYEAEKIVYFNNSEGNQNNDDFYPCANSHPNIIKIYSMIIDLTLREKYNFIVMELMEFSLFDYIRKNDHGVGDFFSIRREDQIAAIKKITRGILDGLRFIHVNRFIHGDIKPANILLTKGPNGIEIDKVKIADFGAALHEAKQHEIDFDYVTVTNRAPELFLRSFGARSDNNDLKTATMNMPITNKVDIYACGVTVYQMWYCLTQTFYPTILYGQDMPAFENSQNKFMWLRSMYRKYGNPKQYPQDQRWNDGITIMGLLRQVDLFFVNLDSMEREPWSINTMQEMMFNDKMPDFCQLVYDMLGYNPDLRPSAEQLLAYPFLEYGPIQPLVAKTTHFRYE